MALAALTLSTSASAHPVHSSKDRLPCEHRTTTHRHGLADFERELGGSQNKDALRHYRHCARTPHKRERMRELAKEARQQEETSWCAPHPDPAGAGCWVIPVSCVMSESGGSWSAYNPSGARGAYQLLSHGEPWPVNSRADAMAHHRIAADLYASYGLQPWVAPGC